MGPDLEIKAERAQGKCKEVASQWRKRPPWETRGWGNLEGAMRLSSPRQDDSEAQWVSLLGDLLRLPHGSL